jgi:UPF0755 protein
VVAVIVALWFLLSLFQPFKGDAGETVRVNIPNGAGVDEIGDQLEDAGVVSSSFFFGLRAGLSGRRDDLKPGLYVGALKRDMSYGDALNALAEGPSNEVFSVAIVEGRSRREAADVVRDAGVRGSYLDASKRSSLLDPSDYGAKRARDLEGFLFPATYDLRRGASARELVRKQLQAFKREFRAVDLAAAKRRNLTPYDVLIIASLVEREAQLDKERPLIASVIYNRLRRQEPLGIDATVRFATGNWTRPLTESELASDSPYNTRARAGLPPGPIGSPGLESIRAAARPESTDYMFYVVKPGTCGEHAFSSTAAQFEEDRRRYNAEREARGGRSPTDC